MSNYWAVSTSLKGQYAHLYERSRKEVFWHWVESAFESIDSALGHRLCGANWPEFMWDIPLGKSVRADDGMLETSVASVVWNAYQKFSALMSRLSDGEEIMRLELNGEQFKKLWPEVAFLLEDED